MPRKDEFDFGKHYFLLDKKLKDHITAKNDPHKVSKWQIGLSLVENLPLKKDFNFEPEEQDSYISALAVKEQIDEINKKLPAVPSEEGEYVLHATVTITQGKAQITYHWEKQ